MILTVQQNKNSQQITLAVSCSYFDSSCLIQTNETGTANSYQKNTPESTESDCLTCYQLVTSNIVCIYECHSALQRLPVQEINASSSTKWVCFRILLSIVQACCCLHDWRAQSATCSKKDVLLLRWVQQHSYTYLRCYQLGQLHFQTNCLCSLDSAYLYFTELKPKHIYRRATKEQKNIRYTYSYIVTFK